MSIEHKTVGATIKQVGDDGTFEAVIATFGEIDKDADIVEHGAFGGATVPVLPAHDQQHVPLGKARIEERGDLAVAVGQFNTEIEAARDWHSALKFDLANLAPPVQEWSWGFRPVKVSQDTVDNQPVRRLIKLDTREVSPVIRGAAIGTATISAKAGDGEDPPTLIEHVGLVTKDVEALIARIREVAEGRKDRGRKLGKDVRLATVQMAEQCAKVLDELALTIEDEMLPEDQIAKAAVNFLAHEALRRGIVS